MADVTLASQLNLFATRVGTECKTIKGSVTALTTRVTALEGKTFIDDSAKSTTKAYSSSKVEDLITSAKQAVKSDLLGGAGDAYDTLKELADLITTNKDAITALQTIAAGHVRFDIAQELTDVQKKQARDNIGAVTAADVSTSVTAVADRVTALETWKGTTDTTLTTHTQGIAANKTAAAGAKTAADNAQKAANKAQSDVTALKTAVGDTTTDFVATFEAALNAAA